MAGTRETGARRGRSEKSKTMLPSAALIMVANSCLASQSCNSCSHSSCTVLYVHCVLQIAAFYYRIPNVLSLHRKKDDSPNASTAAAANSVESLNHDSPGSSVVPIETAGRCSCCLSFQE